MPRVLYLSPGVFDKGGISRYTRYQARALRDLLGARAVTLLSLLPPDANALEDPFAVDFASFGPTLSGKALFAAAAASAALAERPAIVWAAHLGLAPLGHAIARAVGAKAVVNVYGLEVWTSPRPLAVQALRRADHVVSDCHNTRDYALSHGLATEARSSVHWDCVDVDRFCPGPAGDVLERHGVPPAAGRMTVITLGRLGRDTRYKGFDRLLDVIARVASHVPVRLVVGGDGDARRELEARAPAGLAHFVGRVTERDLPLFYRSGDVFSMITDAGPGRGEGLPLTPLEAAGVGLPILVGNQDGSREAAEDGVSGFVLDPFDLDAIADRLVRLARDPALRARMGAAARVRIEREHSFERFRERTADLLRTLGVAHTEPAPGAGLA